MGEVIDSSFPSSGGGDDSFSLEAPGGTPEFLSKDLTVDFEEFDLDDLQDKLLKVRRGEREEGGGEEKKGGERGGL